MTNTSSLSTVAEEGFTTLPIPVKGRADWRDYRCLRLSNGVTVCLVHDRESKTTAAAATVNAGAGADPRSVPGIAHFCEHMVFLGSEKYPGENDYKSFLAQHGGRSNASTSMNLTTFKFEVIAPHAEKALDMFSHFFVAPLFTHSGTSREVHAVDSENSKNLTADERRRLQVLKDLADPNHYYSKFSTGNSKTMPTTTPEEVEHLRNVLLAFHSKHYRPDQLTVVVAGPQSLDELEAWTIPRFAQMRSRPFPASGESMTRAESLVTEGANDAPAYSFDEVCADNSATSFRSPFRSDLQDGKWPIMITTKPVQAVRRLAMMFPLPSVHLQPDRSPTSMLSHLLGHEGRHSSFAELQNAGLLSSLSAGPRSSGPDFTLFQVNIGLTEKGEENWKQVVDVVLQHCRLISEAATRLSTSEDCSEATVFDLRRIWAESAQLRAMFFHQSSPDSVYDLAPNLSASIVKFSTENALSAGSMLKETMETCPLKDIAEFASRLVVENCIIERCSKKAWEEMEEVERTSSEITTKRITEKWYEVDYFFSHIPSKDIAAWNDSTGETSFFNARALLRLPRPNMFIPRSLELSEELPEEAKIGPRIENSINPPNLLVDEKGRRLWHRLDDRYALPKSVVKILIRNAAVAHEKSADNDTWTQSSEAIVHSTLLSAIFSEAMAQEIYDADLAGLHGSLSLSTAGIQISCNGYSDRLEDFALKILNDFLAGNFLTESFFRSAQDRVSRSLRAFFESRRADSYGVYYRDFLLASVDSGVEDALRITEKATVISTKDYLQKILQNEESSLECLCIGNVSNKEAEKFFSEVCCGIDKSTSFGKSISRHPVWVPDTMERRLPQQDLELHFSSRNPQEENGSVLVTFQSPIPGFRGDYLSSDESLRSTSTIRLLCQILREPLFDELRTKQTIGYVVSSYYDLAYSVLPDSGPPYQNSAIPVDYVVINVLSRKVAPPDIIKRIDEFLVSFRTLLENMPASEILHHKDALSTMLLKPTQKLSQEAAGCFNKIRRCAPEIIGKGDSSGDPGAPIPWNNAPALARTIRSLTREDLLTTYDVLMSSRLRSRVVSCVYGKTFPLPKTLETSSIENVIVNDLSRIMALRGKLPAYGHNKCAPSWSPSKITVGQKKITAVGLATAAFLGVSLCVLTSRLKKVTKS